MTLSTLAALRAPLPGRRIMGYKTASLSAAWRISFWTSAGVPVVAGAVPPTGVGEVPTNATAGALPIVNPASGNTLYLARARSLYWSTTQPNQGAYYVLMDRLVHTSGLSANVTTAQTVNSVSVNRPDSTGTDATAWLEIYTAIGSTNSAVTVSYTNQAGVAGQAGTSTLGASPQSAAGNLVPVQLQAGDTGVQSVQSVTLAGGTGTVGNFGVTIAREIAWLVYDGLTVNMITGDDDYLKLGLPVIPANACLFLGGQPGSNVTPLFDLNFVEG